MDPCFEPPVARLMTLAPSSVTPRSPLPEVIEGLRRRPSGCVVVCEGEHPVGIVRPADLMRARAALLARDAVAADLMSSPVVSVCAATSVSEAVELMRRCRIQRLPVVDEQGRLAGVVALDALLQQRAAQLEAWGLELERRVAARERALRERPATSVPAV